MALAVTIELDNGITVAYHRIVSVGIVTNIQNTIEVCSYTSQAKREEERKAIEDGVAFDAYMSTTFYAAPYDEAMTVPDAYAWLKSNAAEFADAQDVLEDDGI